MKWYEKPRFFEAIVIGGLMAGISLSFPLWLSDRAFPLAPVLFRDLTLPSPLDELLLLALATSMLLVLAFPKSTRYLFALIGSLAVLLFLDQGRWQPWVLLYFFFLVGFSFIRLRQNEARRETVYDLFRVMLIALYGWGALQKLNVSFLTELGPWLLSAVPFFGPTLASSPNAALLLPALELLFALGLFFPKTRRAAVVAGVLYHLGALVALGPAGHNWNSVVWPWNVAMIFLLVGLFWNAYARIPLQDMARTRHPFTIAVLLFFAFLPALNFFGVWDSYLSFALYSANTKRAEFIMDPAHLRQLPPALWDNVKRDRNGQVRLRMFDWSIEIMNAPRYPEERVFRTGLRWLCDKTGGDVSVEIFSRPHWLTKARKSKVLTCEDV